MDTCYGRIRFNDQNHKENQMTLTHIYTWGNNAKRAALKGRKCRIIKAGGKGSIEIEFENKQREIVSWMSVRKIK